ncbi:biotin--[acetyl-CoA-carboxylase] ligase [Bifidobacterium callimiconis]|uniref:Biotin-acetyl-CoA-carboxylase ligase n=1 Tax=Bifidobacterium callimiconis TaxID=2306973 RepID=A0A430FDZ3_9BIFI|nr:biotin--[acetyl-CoA-carboxylase] ligase [Bifidobacterium callimiconis]MBT1177793.1 biotin--[acetyl-CoA-carboxylase] ligase [Bifidobacterium callimiconis]RSX50981.1 biotin-acetyl-CoA-carboxylase ligase [Bifidobacterium callimiconis]
MQQTDQRNGAECDRDHANRGSVVPTAVERDAVEHDDRDGVVSDAAAFDQLDSVCALTSVDSTNTYATAAVRKALDGLTDNAGSADVARVVCGLFGVGKMNVAAPLSRLCRQLPSERGAEGEELGLPSLRGAVMRSMTEGSRCSASHRPLPMSVVLADTQTAGRGRLGRAWYNEPGGSFIGSYVTAVPKALLDGGSSGWMTMAAGLAAIDAVESVMGELGINSPQSATPTAPLTHEESLSENRLSLKWPNDVFLGGKKLGGILAELAAVRGDTAIIVFGIGMNLFVSEDRLPIEQSTSLHLRVNDINDLPPYETLRNAIANGIAESLRIRLTALANDTTHAVARLRDEVAERSWTLGRHVVAHLATDDGTASGRTVEGTAESINADASLSIRLADGTVHTVTTGDVGVE